MQKTYFYEDDKTYTGADTSNYICKNCGYIVGTWHKGLIPDQMFHFCPWCGAENEGWTGGLPTCGGAE